MSKPVQFEVRHVPKLMIRGGDAIANFIKGKWVHYTIGDGIIARRGKMLISEWQKLRRCPSAPAKEK